MRPSFRKMVCGMIAPESQTSCWRHCRFTRIWRFGRPALGDHRTDREGLQEPWQIPHCMPACSKRISGISALMAVSPKDHLHWLRQQGRSEVRSDPITEYWKGWTAEAHHQGGRVMWQGHMFLWWKIHLLLHARVASLLQVTTPAGYKIPESMQIQCLAGASCKSCCAFLWIQEHVWFCW